MSDRTVEVGRGAVACVLALLLAACGSGAFNPTGGDDDDSDGSSPTTSVTESEDDGDDGATGDEKANDGDDSEGEDGEAQGEGDTDFSIFRLPSGPRTPADVVEDDVYIPLQTGDCSEARSTLDAVWQALKSPRTVLLYQAGISLCGGDRDEAARWLEGASAYGLTGMDAEFYVLDADGQDVGTYRYDCELYKSLLGALQEVSRDRVTCESGQPPPWPDVDPREDPRGGGAPPSPEPSDGEVTDSPSPGIDGTDGTSTPSQG